MLLLAAALIFAGMLGLCAAMERHQTQILMAHLTAPQTRLLRVAATLLLMAGFVAAIIARDWAIGSVVWVVLCGAASVCVVLLLTYMPRLLPRIGLAVLAIGGLSGLLTLL